MAEPTPISARELNDWLQRDPSVQLVDVREPQELALARLGREVIHLPLSGSAQWTGQIEQLLQRDRPVVVLCHSGVRSRQLGSWLIQQQGYGSVWNLEGGIDAWSLEVDPSVPRY